MPSGDFNDMQVRACRLARYDETSATDLAYAADYLNEGYQSLAADDVPWLWLQFEGQVDLTANSDTYTYDSIATALGLDGIEEVRWIINDDTGYGPLHSMSWVELERLSASSQDGDAASEPTMWSRFNDNGSEKIRFYPKPRLAYTMGMHGIVKPGEMSANTDVPLIPFAWRHKMLTRYAVVQLLRQEGGGTAHHEADRFQAQWDRDYLVFRRTYAAFKRPMGNVMSPTFGNDLPSIDSHDTPVLW